MGKTSSRLRRKAKRKERRREYIENASNTYGDFERELCGCLAQRDLGCMSDDTPRNIRMLAWRKDLIAKAAG